MSALAPPRGALSQAFASLGQTDGSQRTGSSVLAQKLHFTISQTPQKAETTFQGAVASKQESSHVNTIARGIRAILASQKANSVDAGQSLESLYLLTEQVVLSGNASAESLYDRVRLELERGIGTVASILKTGSSISSPDTCLAWLQRLHEAWQDWCDKCCIVKGVLTFLDQAYLLEQSGTKSLWALSLELFSLTIIHDDHIQAQLHACIKSCMLESRSGDSKYESIHVSLTAMLKTLGHNTLLENMLDQITAEFCKDQSQQQIGVLSTAQYLDFAEQSLLREQQMSEWLYSDGTGRKRSMEIVQNSLVKSHFSELIKGLPNLLDSASTKSLTQLYMLLKRVAELRPLRDAFGDIIVNKGAIMVQDKEKDDVMIDRLLEYKTVIDKIVKEAFLGDADFRQTQKESFETFINKRENKPAELVAKFLDARLRSGNKTMTDQEMEHVLNEALVLFRYTHAKDMFEEFYTRLFAKRLLLNRSASSDAEQSMLLKLKEECGPSFTQKLETMLTDISLSDEMMKGYASVQAKAASEGKGDGFELSVNVLTQAHWPSYPQVNVIIPADMAKATERFQEFYESRNQGRKLQWTHSLGTTSLTANLSKAGEKELLVSTFQTVVLLLFNDLKDGAKLNYSQIKEQTGLEGKELKRTLQSLACGQIPTRILRKEPQGKEVNESDEFFVNEGLKNERKRIRINMIQINETQEEQKSTVDRVMFDRELILQASAVRILKARKTIKHAELLQEIVKSIASRFVVDIAEIKKTFEILIEKEYMERAEGQRGLYRYLA